MSVKRRTLVSATDLLLLLLLLSSSSSPANAECCKRKAVIFNFGDSNSDTGGFSLGLGIDFGPPTGRAFFPHPTGRFSDGRLIIDLLCETLNISYLTPYMQSVEPDFRNGVNFAVGGASIEPERKPFNLDVQIGHFLQFRARSLQLLSKGFKGLFSTNDFDNALYMIDIGQNDLAYVSYEQVVDQIPSFVNRIQSAILKVYQNGGKNFWVHNTGPAGCLPQILAMNNHTEADLDAQGCIESINSAAKLFNKLLLAMCKQVRSELMDATIVHVDIYSIKLGLIANSSAYGFENPMMACCGYGGAPYNYKAGRACGVPGYNICDASTKFVSWDGVHHSEAANSDFVTKILSTHYSTPPHHFHYFCNV